MPKGKERQDSRSSKQESAEQSKARGRIGRACDRCKIKKSKCDGNLPCSSCVASESICEYSARRRREAREWYWGMHDVIDEALQRLYWACREGRGFPGTLPDESNGRVSTDAILQGLGLIPPPVGLLGPIKSRSDTALEGVRAMAERSYYPPDFQSPTLDRGSTSSSGPTPLSMPRDEQNMLADGLPATEEPGRRNQMDGWQDEVEQASLGPGQRFQESIGDPVDPSMLQNGNEGLMDIDGMMFPDVNALGFQDPTQSGSHEGQTAAQFPGRLPRHQSLQEDYFGSHGSQRGWEDQTADAGGSPLPWPGTLAAIYWDNKPHPDRNDFDPPDRPG